MTSNVDLLPLPELPRQVEGYSSDYWEASQVEEYATDYARACVAHATAARDAEIEALRERVSRLDEVNLELGRQLVDGEDRAERLAEALRFARTRFAPYMDDTDRAAFDAALHPTAAQEGGNVCHHINTVHGEDGVRWCQHCNQQLAQED